LAESHFGKKDFASAALEYNEFRKKASKDPLVPQAIFQQAQSFKGMGKKGEAKLFFQDLIDRYPKSPLVPKAKAELKKLK
jgi:TolA-binding protein